ncbi:MAG: hypothetical protein QW101_06100 [Ignisphaera sp.]|uniref:Uncharacterized protein n=1 Tax=Ignisphaera aggregans TaxID=334771 RepID=A0A7J3MYE2_9CREN
MFFKKLGLLHGARRIRDSVYIVIERYGGRAPGRFRELVKIHGISRYIANVLLIKVCRVPTLFVDINVARSVKRFLE